MCGQQYTMVFHCNRYELEKHGLAYFKHSKLFLDINAYLGLILPCAFPL
mgnify:CR=1 FL=1